MQDYIMDYEEAVEFIYRIPRFNPNHSLKNISDFLEKMGLPNQPMKFIHIAGTNGKGSVSAYLAGLLKRAGLKTGLFTSPHLVDIRERIQINGEMVSKELFLQAAREVFSLFGTKDKGYQPCYFDVLFFIGMYVFAKAKTDVVILETGLGGRLDATNAVKDKLLTLITHIGLDHTQQLGNTLEQIALEKAGIMRRGVPCIVAPYNEQVESVFIKKASELETSCRILTKQDYACQRLYEKYVAFSYFSSYYGTVPVVLHTRAWYQVQNVVLALAGFEQLIEIGFLSKDALSLEQMQDCLFETVWQGRMEEVQEGIVVDGAHNADGMRAFLESVSQDRCIGKRILVFSAVSDKDYQKMLQDILESGLFSHIIVTHIQGERGVLAEVLFEAVKALNAQAECGCIPDVAAAIQTAKEKKKKEDYIYIAGSLYLAGCIKSCDFL